MVVIQKGLDLELLAEFSFSTDRKIYGCAHFPEVDREKEFILSEAIEKALPNFMQHPILHYQHTERPVGTLTKAEIRDGALYVEGSIFDTSDTDDVWHEIESGAINKFSIFGKRVKGTPECSISPVIRSTPCVTKAMVLYSISVVGDNAMNESTFLNVAKGGSMEEDKEKDEKKEEVEKSDTEEVEEKPTLEKSESNISSVLERLGNVEGILSRLVESDKQVHSEMGKGEEEDMADSKKEEETVEKCNDTKMKKAEEPVVKAEEPVSTEKKEEEAPAFITKAALDDEIKKALDKFDTIQKAYSDLKKEHDELKGEVEKIKEFTIQKAGNVVFITGKDTDNPMISNLKAVEG